MKKLFTAAALLTALAAAPASAGGIKIGVLTCEVEGGVGWIIGSSKDVECTFDRSGPGGKENYVGSIGKLGLDVGVTGETVIAWAVFAPGKMKKGSLKGSYTGASAEATLGVGLGANVLIGGFKKSINLQPISIQAQTGISIAAGVASLQLRSR